MIQQTKKPLFFRIFPMIIILMFLFVYPASANTPNPPNQIDLTDGWSYAVGYYPPDQLNQAEWKPLQKLSDMPHRENNPEITNITYKINLPKVTCDDCALQVPGYVRLREIYVDGQLLQDSGAIQERGQSENGKPDFFVDLPMNSTANELVIITNISQSSSPLYNAIYYGEKEIISKTYFADNRVQLVIALIVLLVGLLSGMLYFSLRRDIAFLHLGLCAFNMGLYMFSSTPYTYYLFDSLVFWDMAEYVSLYLSPIIVWYYFLNFVKPNRYIHWSIVGSNGAFLLFAFFQMFRGIPPFEYVNEERYIFLISLLLIIGELVRSAWKGNREARMVVFAFIITCILTISKVILLVFELPNLNLVPVAGGFFMVSQLLIMTNRFRRLNEELRQHTANLERWNELMEIEVRSRTKQVRNLLDHVAQGFLTVQPDLMIEKEHSAACVKLLGYAPAGMNIVDVVAEDDPDSKMWLPRMFKDIFDATDEHIIEMYSQLLPTEIHRNGRTLGLSMEVVRESGQKTQNIIFMISDLSKQRALEDKLKEEEKMLRMVVTVLSRSRDYQELIDDYNQFVDEDLPRLLNNLDAQGEVDKWALRVVHTFKGNFAQMNSIILAHHLHDLENEIRLNPDETIEEWAERVSKFEWKQPLREEQKRMFSILPAHHWQQNKDTISISRDTLVHLRDYIKEQLPMDVSNSLVKEVERLYHKNFASLFESVNENTKQLAERLNKMVKPVNVIGGEWLTDLDPWHEWAKSLIHVTRNQLDHGIETPDDRIDQGKDCEGLVSLEITMDESTVTIKFSDDGAGINTDRLRRRLIEKEMITQEIAQNISNQELYWYLFMDDVSTKEEVSELSGRGVGLAKVLEETKKLDGTIEVVSNLGMGTTFVFSFPVHDGVPLIIRNKDVA